MPELLLAGAGAGAGAALGIHEGTNSLAATLGVNEPALGLRLNAASFLALSSLIVVILLCEMGGGLGKE